MPNLLIFIPTYKERENVGPMCEQLVALGLDADIVFLDDDSPDGTGEVLDALAAKYPRVSVVHRKGARGVGSAHLAGIAYAYDRGYQKLLTMDCDFTHAPSDIPMMLEASEGIDVTIASRYLERDSLPGWTLMRKGLTNLGHLMTENLLGMTNDATGAFRIYDLRTIPRELFDLVSARGYAFFFESLFILHRNEFKLRDVPIKLPARTYGHSKMSFAEVRRSVEQLFTLYVGTKANPAQFLLSKDEIEIDETLDDPQGWDDYWGRKTEKKAVAYEGAAALYRNLVSRRRLEEVVRKVFPPGARVLHAGCGSGQVDVSLHDHVRITAVDISPQALKLYKHENPRCDAIKHASLFSLPFRDATFDGAYNLGVVEHFDREQLERIFKELHRVVKPGGKLVLFWPHAHAASVMVLDTIHWMMNDVLEKNVRFHPPEVSLVHSKREAGDILASSSFELVSYDFGPKDLFEQAVVVAERR